MRAFLACSIDTRTRSVLDRCESALKQAGIAGKWTAPAGRHMTVIFLGDVSHSLVDRVRECTRAACRASSPMAFEGGRLSVFGRPPRVLCAELAQSRAGTRFAALADALKECFIRANVLTDDARGGRQAVPHVTLCRFRGRRESSSIRSPAVGAIWQEVSSRISAIRCTCREVCLFESVLTAQGARYHQLEAFPLAAEGTPAATQD